MPTEPDAQAIEAARALDELLHVGPEVPLRTEQERREWRTHTLAAYIAQRAADARREERERCAKIAETRCDAQRASEMGHHKEIAAAIRAEETPDADD